MDERTDRTNDKPNNPAENFQQGKWIESICPISAYNCITTEPGYNRIASFSREVLSGVPKNVPLSHKNVPLVLERTLHMDTAQQDI